MYLTHVDLAYKQARRVQILIPKALFLCFVSYGDDVIACDVHAVLSQLLNHER